MSITVRTYCKGETLPEKLQTGYEMGEATDPNWIFILERDGEPIGILITAPAHLAVVLLRILMIDNSCFSALRIFLLNVFKICQSRGLKAYVTWLDPTEEVGRELLGIVRSSGGVQPTCPQVICMGGF